MNKVWRTTMAMIAAVGLFGSNPTLAQEPTAEFSVANGQPRESREFKELVFVDIDYQDGRGGGYCTGTILADEWVLTAGHCFQINRTPKVKVIAQTAFSQDERGRVLREEYPVQRVIIHPNYRNIIVRNYLDVALLKLEKPISAGKPRDPLTKRELKRDPNADLRVPAVELAPNDIDIPQSGQARVVGRGSTHGEPIEYNGERISLPAGNPYHYVRSAAVPIKPPCGSNLMICAEEPIDISGLKDLPIEERHDRKKHRNPASCWGDSGGPLYDEYAPGKRRQIGIVSHSKVSEDNYNFWEGDVCGRVSTSYTAVSFVRPWIEGVMKANPGPSDPVPRVYLPVPVYDPTQPESYIPQIQPDAGETPESTPSTNPNPPSSTPQPPVTPTPPKTEEEPKDPMGQVPPVPKPNLPLVTDPPAGQPNPAPEPVPPVVPPAPVPVPPAQPPANGGGQPAPAPKPPSTSPSPSPLVPSRPNDAPVLRRLPQPGQETVSWTVPATTTQDGSDLSIGINRLRHGYAALRGSSIGHPSKRVALLANEQTSADALASGVLQQHGTLYLTTSTQLEPAVLTELKETGVEEVWLLGGPKALDPAIESTLHANGITTKRIAGADRVETAKAIAAVVTDTAEARSPMQYVARAFGDGKDETRSWADSIALGGLAAKTDVPVLLSSTDVLSPGVRTALAKGTPTTIIGGHAAISQSVGEQITQITGAVPTRLAGLNRADTAAQIARQFKRATHAIVIDGQHKDAWQLGFSLAGLSRDLNAPILLAYGTTVPDETKQALKDLGIKHTICIGQDAMCTQVKQ